MTEVSELTRLAFMAKRHWGYPEAWLELWRSELEYTATRFESEHILVAEIEGRLVGVGSISVEPPEAELEGLWVHPAAMRRGVGRALFEELRRAASERGGADLIVVSDPQAVGFYQRMGAAVIGTVESRPAGRLLPRLRVSLTGTGGNAAPT